MDANLNATYEACNSFNNKVPNQNGIYHSPPVREADSPRAFAMSLNNHTQRIQLASAT